MIFLPRGPTRTFLTVLSFFLSFFLLYFLALSLDLFYIRTGYTQAVAYNIASDLYTNEIAIVYVNQYLANAGLNVYTLRER